MSPIVEAMLRLIHTTQTPIAHLDFEPEDHHNGGAQQEGESS